MNKSLLKIMGKMGITDVNNCSNGKLMAAVELGLSAGDEVVLEDDLSLGNVFRDFYSPFKGVNLGHITNGFFARSREAANDDLDFSLLPHQGRFRPDSKGTKHGFGPEVVAAYKKWELELGTKRSLQILDASLKAIGYPSYSIDGKELLN